jgi:hypothetical protein
VNWSADGKLITIIPVRWDATESCRAFYFDGTSYFSVDKPFGESQVVAVAFSDRQRDGNGIFQRVLTIVELE